jgi:hypothetical protein
MHYTMKPSGLGRPDDYVFRYDGLDVGRCYLKTIAANEQRWVWSIYIGLYVKAKPEAMMTGGMADTLEQAQLEFRETFDRIVAAGMFDSRWPVSVPLLGQGKDPG